ncbi:50S ribosomal protein L28 [Peptoniphilus equinus]|uniref:Large ribosomal subunit protein bL28 n=1 Tax=Peptoniphilus equinus TaxID=3016343 RepID=A0ABY7QTU6_9FIRM|nr:50S ribosomal protein L28 [Peptoniphilus equinus]WBW49583.1 50S ribosomal protein L28 [Peptoniphilus equinus]
MSKKCEYCGKTKTFGNTISFSHKRGNRSFSPNLRRVKVNKDGVVKRAYVCTRCLRTEGLVERAQ